ncbi:MAG: glycosyltransferase, partial [bacterium]|nr:glycosyltransferase [bacterium]
MEREGERGLGGAYRAGLKYGMEKEYEILMTMDADHSHNPLHLRAMLSALEGNDVVIGSRYMRDGGTINWRIRRILLSWLANRFARFLLSLKGSDLTSGFRGYRRGILEAVGLKHVKSNGYSYLVEMLFRTQRKNARVAEVPIIFFDRSLGKSKISRKEIYRGILTLVRLRFSTRKDKQG